VLLVAGDQRRVSLGGETVGKVKRAGSQGVHVISSDLSRWPPSGVARRRATHTSTTSHAFRDSCLRGFWPSAGDSTARPGSCRKPPGALYIESGEAWPFGPAHSLRDSLSVTSQRWIALQLASFPPVGVTDDHACRPAGDADADKRCVREPTGSGLVPQDAEAGIQATARNRKRAAHPAGRIPRAQPSRVDDRDKVSPWPSAERRCRAVTTARKGGTAGPTVGPSLTEGTETAASGDSTSKFAR
jgi:hypothetical protein